jgi:hypothetical protein
MTGILSGISKRAPKPGFNRKTAENKPSAPTITVVSGFFFSSISALEAPAR